MHKLPTPADRSPPTAGHFPYRTGLRPRRTAKTGSTATHRSLFARRRPSRSASTRRHGCGERSRRPCNGRSDIAANDPTSQHDPASQRTDRQARPDGSRLRTPQQRRRALQQKTPGAATKATGFLAAEAAGIAAGAAGFLAARADECDNGQQVRHPDRQRGESPPQAAADAISGGYRSGTLDYLTATASISTLAPIGSLATSKQTRAGIPSVK